MTRRQVYRYYCEFCKKAGCSGGHIRKHEKGCTANPGRVCGLCAHVKADQAPLADLASAFDKSQKDFGLTRARELSHNCPACILSAIRSSKANEWFLDFAGQEEAPSLEFDFPAEMKRFWQSVNEAEAAMGDY